MAYICDVSPSSRELARKLSPESEIIENEQKIFDDPTVQVVGLFALANSRKEQIERAIQSGKHVISEKPIADTITREWNAVSVAESTDLFSTVNLYLRNSWYHKLIKDFIQKGEIGELAIIRICHLTPGLAPGEGHEYEGPSFHDCGMHYVDIARWYTDCNFRTWMRRLYGCGIIKTRGGYNVTAHLRMVLFSILHKDTYMDNYRPSKHTTHI